MGERENQKRAVRFARISAVLWVLGLGGGLLAAGIFSISIGRYYVPFPTILHVLFRGIATARPFTDTDVVVIETVRLPRVLLAITAGAGLSLAGAAWWPLQSPGGPTNCRDPRRCIVRGALGILFSVSAFGVVGLAFCFGFIALIAVFAMDRLIGRGAVLSLILCGVVCSSFFAALVGVLQYFADPDNKLPGIVFWLLGSLVDSDWERLAVIAVPTLTAWRGDPANALAIESPLVGRFRRLRARYQRAAQPLDFAGPDHIDRRRSGFSKRRDRMGRPIVTICRMLVGTDHRLLVPVSALLGGLYMLAMDDCARVLTTQEIPLGILTALIGTPIFAVVVWRTQAMGWSRD